MFVLHRRRSEPVVNRPHSVEFSTASYTTNTDFPLFARFVLRDFVTFTLVSIPTSQSHALASPSFTATSLSMSYDLDFGKKNSYVPASGGDGGQGQFGAVSPNDWRVPGTSPVGQSSYPGAPDGGDEPWFSEAVSTVSLDLKKAEDTLKAFTKEAAELKLEAFCSKVGVKDSAKVMDTLVGAMGYGKFLEASPKQLEAAWEKANGKEE